MKTTTLFIVGFCLALNLACNSKTENSSSPKEEKNTVLADAVTEPSNLISISEAKQQLDNYKSAHPGVNGSEYALRTWVSIEELENYIAFVKQEAKKKNIDVNGIDFIYTQYKKAAPNAANLENKEYELTFMYAPTFKEGTKNTAFDPIRSKDGKPAKLRELLVTSMEKKDSTAKDGNTENEDGISGIGNKANSCPLKCN